MSPFAIGLMVNIFGVPVEVKTGGWIPRGFLNSIDFIGHEIPN